MTTWISWEGVIARLNEPTNDGRTLMKSEFAAAHFPAFPIPVYARAKRVEPTSITPTLGKQLEEPRPNLVVGRIDRVSIRRAEWPMKGFEVFAEGMITLEDLLTVRPDLEIPNPLVHDNAPWPWPVGIEVRNGTFEGDENAGTLVCAGNWELSAMTIEEDPAVWPGVGISPTSFEMSAS